MLGKILYHYHNNEGKIKNLDLNYLRNLVPSHNQKILHRICKINMLQILMLS